MSVPEKLYVEKSVLTHPLTERILGKLPSTPVITVDDYKSIGSSKSLPQKAEEDKNSLALAVNKGGMLKSIGRMEEGEYYLFHEMDCKYDCEYCYLQYYFQTKVPVIFVNRDRALEEMEDVLIAHPKPYFHVGEVSDALAFDPLTGFSTEAAALFARYPNGTIEFRTKSTNVEGLTSIPNPPPNVVPSWTLSPERVARAIEHKTPGLSERLEAARKCQDAGYTVGVRLDPILVFEGWEVEYKTMIEQIFAVLNPSMIDYISLGTPKVHKQLIEVMRKRFPTSPVLLGELFPSPDGKYRYLKFQRIDVYEKTASWIRRFNREVEMKLSLESPEVESMVFGNNPTKRP
ncbi:MAG: hypothetical protein IH874_06515 [Candidatus Dadabacteria bacterium]|nr:hypothetical protein [Candidatus Dadabacteria bacterium]